MKLARRLITLAIVMAMVMAFMIPTAMAASDGTIKIENTVSGKSYSIYKVFDATYSGENVVYTYDGSNTTFLTALQAVDSPFTVTANTSGTYNISLKDGKVAADISTFLKNQVANLGTAKQVDGNGGTATVDSLAYGYYYITTTIGTNVTIDSVTPTATVIDKNTEVPDVTKKAYDANNKEVADAAIGETIYYKLTGDIMRYDGTDRVEKLVFTDKMSNALTAKKDVVVKVGDKTLVKGADYTVTYTDDADGSTTTVIELTVSTKEEGEDPDFKFNNGDAYEITYSAVVNENAIDSSATNKATVGVNKATDIGDDTPGSTVTPHKITLTKQDAKDSTKNLANAQFKLYDAATGGNEIKVVLVENTEAGEKYGTAESAVNNVYRLATGDETGVVMITGETGIIEIKGLGNGDYYFEEIMPPAGYNPLPARTEVTTISDADATITVLNSTGSVLPSTGGIGTTIFYVLGSLMFLGALVLLVTNKRMRAE